MTNVILPNHNITVHRMESCKPALVLRYRFNCSLLVLFCRERDQLFLSAANEPLTGYKAYKDYEFGELV